VSTPAILICDPAVSAARVAALTLLDRLVVAAARAGCAPITVVGDEALPDLKRSRALGIAVETARTVPPVNEPTLVATANVLVHSSDVRRVLEFRGRLTDAAGAPLPVGVLGGVPTDLVADMAGLPPVRAERLALRVADAAAARKAERALWASLTSEADGLVDRWFNRPVGRLLSKVLIHTSVTPNQVSVFATLAGLVSAACFALGTPAAFLTGALVLQLSAIIDCVDGDLARVLFKESRIGKWLDIVGDQIVHVAVFVCLGVGLARAGPAAPVLALAISAGVGVVISFLVVLRGMLQPEERRSSRFQKLIDATTNRDFSVLLLALALIGRLEWFLWLAGIGVHVFWLVALAVQFQGNGAARPSRNQAKAGTPHPPSGHPLPSSDEGRGQGEGRRCKSSQAPTILREGTAGNVAAEPHENRP
jgi:phosphatidylglycerophosphate synthase